MSRKDYILATKFCETKQIADAFIKFFGESRGAFDVVKFKNAIDYENLSD